MSWVEQIDQQMYNLDIPGLVVGVQTEDKTVIRRAFGKADVSVDRPMQTEDVFHMASISKLVTATAIMQLHERELLNIEEKALSYLTGFKPASRAFDNITLKHMLSHTSGLPDCEDYEWDRPRWDEQALADYVMSQTDLRLVHQPGDLFLYSNIAYEMLGYVVECVSGVSFEDYCHQHIFLPADMDRSDFLKSRIPEEALVMPHVKDEHMKIRRSSLFPYNRCHAPSSTLYAPLEDVMTFSQVVQDTLKGQRSDILSKETLGYMLQLHATIKAKEGVGLGWFLSDYRDERFVGHEGNDIGFRTTFALIPSKKTSIVVLANIQKASTRKIMRMLYDTVFP